MMKNEVLYLLLDRYADHEAVFLASAHCPITRSTPCLMIMPHWC